MKKLLILLFIPFIAQAQPIPGTVYSKQSGAWTNACTQSGTWNVTNISGTVSLPTGAATEATLSTINGKVTACNTGAVTVSAALPAGTNGIGKLTSNSGVTIGAVELAASQTLATVTNLATIGTSIVPGTSATHLGKAEDGAHASGDTGVLSLAVRNDTIAAPTNADLDYSPITVDKYGRPIVVFGAGPEARSTGTATTTATTDTSLVAASGSAGLKTYITDCQFVNTGSTTTLITLKDGSGGSTLAYTIAPSGGGSNVRYSTPLVTTANTALFFAAASASTTVYASCQGFKAP